MLWASRVDVSAFTTPALVTVNGEDRVSAAIGQGEHLDPRYHACVAQAIDGARAPSHAGTSFTVEVRTYLGSWWTEPRDWTRPLAIAAGALALAAVAFALVRVRWRRRRAASGR
jgi:hypothetical protein